MEECACLCGVGPSRGCRCRQELQGPAETAAAEGKPAPAEKHLEADTAARCWAGSGGIASPRPPPHCSLQELSVEMLVEIFALLPRTELPSLAQVCTKFRHILHIDSIWRQRCREDYGLRENLQDLDRIGMSYGEVYAKIFPYRNILGLWKLRESCRGLLNVVVDGLGIIGWTYNPSLNTHVDGPMQSDPSFRIRLTERKSSRVECMDGFYSLSHRRHLQVQKDRFSIEWLMRDHQKDSGTRLRGERVLLVFEDDREAYDDQTYRRVYHQPDETYGRVYLPPRNPDDLIRPGLFQVKRRPSSLVIEMLSFHGKYAWVTEITGVTSWRTEIHLLRRMQLPDGEFFRDFNELSRVVRKIDEQVFRKQQQEDGTDESEGHGWQSPAQPSVGESGAAATEEQPVPFVLPVGVRSMDQNYPGTCRMCFYGVTVDTLDPYRRRCPKVFILFDENHFRITCGEYFNLYQQSPEHLPECAGTIPAGLPGDALKH